MKDALELLFSTREDLRAWLTENAETSGGVWLVFGKAKAVISVVRERRLGRGARKGFFEDR